MELTLGILLLVCALFLIVSILMQSGKSKKLSGTIAGGAETFFGKQKGKAVDKVLSRVTNVVVVIFIILVIALFLISASDDNASTGSTSSTQSTSSVEASAEESAEASVEASAEASAEVSAEASSETPSETPSEVSAKSCEVCCEGVEDSSVSEDGTTLFEPSVQAEKVSAVTVSRHRRTVKALRFRFCSILLARFSFLFLVLGFCSFP